MSEIYEIATVSVRPGAIQRVEDGIWAHLTSTTARGTLIGCWIADIGPLNRVMLLRVFDDHAQAHAERERTLRGDRPFGVDPDVIDGFEVGSHRAFPGLPRPEPGEYGPFYEIRTYHLRPGGLSPTLAAWSEALPLRTKVSPLTLALYALDGRPRITHLWPYRSLEERGRRRTEAVTRGWWPPKSLSWLEGDLQSTIGLPARISPLR